MAMGDFPWGLFDQYIDLRIELSSINQFSDDPEDTEHRERVLDELSVTKTNLERSLGRWV